MQYQSNTQFQQEPNRGRKIILIVVGFVVICVVLGIYLASSKKQKASESYYDEGSGQTVSSPEGKVAETAGNTATSDVVYLGFHKLLEIGVGQSQLEEVRQLFKIYGYEKDKNLSVVSITVSTVKRTAPDRESEDFRDIIEFSGTINRTEAYQATIEFTDTTTARLILKDGGGKQIYDSGLVNNYSGD